jgi:hypothetical protein
VRSAKLPAGTLSGRTIINTSIYVNYTRVLNLWCHCCFPILQCMTPRHFSTPIFGTNLHADDEAMVVAWLMMHKLVFRKMVRPEGTGFYVNRIPFPTSFFIKKLGYKPLNSKNRRVLKNNIVRRQFFLKTLEAIEEHFGRACEHIFALAEGHLPEGITTKARGKLNYSVIVPPMVYTHDAGKDQMWLSCHFCVANVTPTLHVNMPKDYGDDKFTLKHLGTSSDYTLAALKLRVGSLVAIRNDAPGPELVANMQKRLLEELTECGEPHGAADDLQLECVKDALPLSLVKQEAELAKYPPGTLVVYAVSGWHLNFQVGKVSIYVRACFPSVCSFSSLLLRTLPPIPPPPPPHLVL